MARELFTSDWTVCDADGHSRSVRLPHDAMITEPRSPSAATSHHTGYFPGGKYSYTKRWSPPADLENDSITLEFEGVYRDSVVRVNGIEMGACRGGYTEFEVPIEEAISWGEENIIEVEVDNSKTPNGRWYTGSGIYRPVWLRTHGPTWFPRDGVFARALSVGDPAVAELVVEIAGDLDGIEARWSVGHQGVIVADGTENVSDRQHHVTFEIPQPNLWSVDSPFLYDVSVALLADDRVLDVATARLGLRSVSTSPSKGLVINGHTTLLRGACIHHDNGVIGAVTLPAAEERRVRILKENGFNAIRSAHNPASRALLDACDKLGMLVLDEQFDSWFTPKTTHDAAEHFEETWRDDLSAMVRRDRSHPSVFMYSIGNEVGETASPRGVSLAAEMVQHVRSLDPHRPITAGINPMLNVMTSFGIDMISAATESSATDPSTKDSAGGNTNSSQVFNVFMNKLGAVMKAISLTPRADSSTREVYDALDVAGYNYAALRYKRDARKYPGRVLLGTESMPTDIDYNWRQARELPALIGDFIWTGWDHLGESGVGSWMYGTRRGPLMKEYPFVLSGCGAVDITGLPGSTMALVRAGWGDLTTPRILVRPLTRTGQKVTRSAWRRTDAIESWSWRGYEGTGAEIQVISDADHVELIINGEVIEKRRVRRNIATFHTRYVPGTITALAYRSGRVVGTSSLNSASGPLSLRLTSDTKSLQADGDDLAHIAIEIVDVDGTIESAADTKVDVAVEGCADLIGLGSAAPAMEESYVDAEHTTYFGRALAVLRATDSAGPVTVRVTGPGLAEATMQLQSIMPGTGRIGES